MSKPKLCLECQVPIRPQDRESIKGPLPQRHKECKLFRDQRSEWTRAVRKYKRREMFRGES